MTREIVNAKIESTLLGYEDYGIFTCFLYLDYAGAGQGFGGWTLDEPINDENDNFIERVGVAFGAEFILQILKTLEVDTWEKLPETSIRADKEHSKVHGIGHYLKDNWFYPEKLASHMIKEK